MFLRDQYWDMHCFTPLQGDIERDVEGTLSKFADNTKLCGAVFTLQGRDALNRLETWDCANLMKFNKAECKILCVGVGNPRHEYRLDRERIESSPGEKNLGV